VSNKLDIDNFKFKKIEHFHCPNFNELNTPHNYHISRLMCFICSTCTSARSEETFLFTQSDQNENKSEQALQIIVNKLSIAWA
jgi:hypothetical protein